MKKIILAVLTAALLAGVLIACAPVAGGDTTPPTISATTPSGTSVATNAVITATFDEAMTATTIVAANFTVSPSVAGTVSYNATSMVATFTPTSGLGNSTVYTATITTGVKDLAGNAMAANKVWSFTTVAGSTASIVTTPANSATGVALTINNNVRATFSAAMDPTTIVGANFTLATTSGAVAVVGAVTYDVPNKTAIFAPATVLAVNTSYTATLTTGVKDIGGNPLAANKVWTFTTITSAGAGPVPVVLETAGNYAILAHAGITDVPTSAITGNMGISPQAESTITGFTLTNVGTPVVYATTPEVVGGGNVYASDMSGGSTTADLTKASLDVTTAYNDAFGRPAATGANLNSGTPAGTIGGLTFLPGVYTWTSTVVIPVAGITINGGANDIWIFQISNDLTVASHAIITLTGGAQAKNIFWQVAGQTVLNTGASFQGIILDWADVQLLTGATLNGRAFSHTTQVVLQAATVTQP